MKLVVKKSQIPNAGKGLFAGEEVPKGVIIGAYKGRYMNKKKFKKLKDQNYVWELNDNLYVDGKNCVKGNPLRYVNSPKGSKFKENLEAYQYAKRIKYRTTKKVKKGEEFFIDYGDDYTFD